jgi:hypothetical protein
MSVPDFGPLVIDFRRIQMSPIILTLIDFLASTIFLTLTVRRSLDFFSQHQPIQAVII